MALWFKFEKYVYIYIERAQYKAIWQRKSTRQMRPVCLIRRV